MANMHLTSDIISKMLIMLVHINTLELMTEGDDGDRYRSSDDIAEPTATFRMHLLPQDLTLTMDDIETIHLAPIAARIIDEIMKRPAATFHRLDSPAGAYKCAVNQYRGLWLRVLPMYDGISDDIVFRVDISHS